MKFFLTIIVILVFSILASAEKAVLRDIRVSSQDSVYRVIFKGEGKFEYTSSSVQNPPKIILEFGDVEYKLKSRHLAPKKNDYLSNVQVYEKLRGEKKHLYITLNLKSDLAFSVSPNRDGFEVQLTPREVTQEQNVPASEKKVSNPASEVKKVPATEKKASNPVSGAEKVPATEIKASNPATGGANVPPSETKVSNPASGVLPSTPPPKLPPRNLDIVIGAEDLVQVTVFELPEFGIETRVSGDGTITMPLIGSVEIRGLTKKEAEKKIAAALEANYVNNPNVALSVKEYKSKQVSVLGAVTNPGPYYILSHRTLVQLISEAGGLTSEAEKKCFIFRPGSPRIEVDLKELMDTGNPNENISILPGDVINIPPIRKVIIYVLGAVKSPGLVELTSNMPITLVAAIAKAGGLLDEANKSKIQITRTNGNGKQEVMKANLKDILKGKIPDVPLFAGDVINVPESFF